MSQRPLFTLAKANILAAALVATTFAIVGEAQTPAPDVGSQPSAETVRSLLMNNWTDTVAVHYARQLYKKDSHLFGPYLAGFYSATDWTVSQIDGATAFFHADVLDASPSGNGNGKGPVTGPERAAGLCESSGDVRGDDAPADPGLRQSYPSIMCFDDGGVMNVEYLRETERGLPIQIEKAYAMVPAQGFLVVRYALTNNILPQDGKKVHVRFAEVVDVHNKAAPGRPKAAEALVDTGLYQPPPDQPRQNMQAQWHSEVNAWIADLSRSNGTFLVFGPLQDIDRHRAFQPVADDVEFDRAVAPEMDLIDQTGVPDNVDALTAPDLGLSLWKDVVLAPGSKQQYYFFYAATSSLAEALRVAVAARSATTPEFWFNETRRAYQTWLQQGRQFKTPDPGLGRALTRALITNKQAQQPEFGSFVAATNPAYGFKVWPRDSSVTALGFAATGHLDEAVKFYRWLASVQEDGSVPNHPLGTWFSNYSFWLRKGPKTFVEPEMDAPGLFLIGVYHTWGLLNAQDPQAAVRFLNNYVDSPGAGPTSVYDAVRRAADFINSTINDHAFGPGDFSIWEEDFQWNTFTQVTYASGLNAARLLAQKMGDTDRASQWTASAGRLLEAIDRPASAQPCPGLWNDTEARWNRGAGINCSRDDRLDASTDLVWVFGLIDATDDRVNSQRQAVLSRLTPGEDDIGIARYEGDEFYHQKDVSPGGQFEASASMPSWPQMDMYMAMLEHWRGLDETALQRLQWYVRVTNVGYMPPGEAVDWPTDRPLPSPSAEPVTASWVALALLNYLNLFDPRLTPLLSPPGS